MLNQGKNKDINGILGILAIFAILFAYSIYTQPTQEELYKIKRERDSIAEAGQLKQEQPSQPPIQPDSETYTSDNIEADDIAPGIEAGLYDSLSNAQIISKYGPFAGAAVGEEEFITIENELVKIAISTEGGKVHTVELKKYKTFDSLPLILFDGDSAKFGINFFAGNKSISTDQLYFRTEGRSFKVKGNDSKSLSMRLYADDDRYIEYLYTLSGNSYLLDFDINFNKIDKLVAANTGYITIDWSAHMLQKEKVLKNERMVSTIYYKYLNDEVDYLSETSDESKTLQTKIKWIAFQQQFFSTFIIADNEFEKPSYIQTITDETSDKYVKGMTASLTIPYEHKPLETFNSRFYFGPNHYNTLKEFGIEMERVIPLGWGIFGWINKGLIIPMFNFLQDYIKSYGIIILILTVVIKLILFPLMYKSYLSTARMRVLKPETEEINKKFPRSEDAMKKQQAIMQLYKRTGVNPLGGCLPMVVQFPILIAMYRFFPASIELRQQSFLWADDLSSYDSILDLSFNIPFYGDHVSLFTLLMTAATLLSVKMNTEMSGGQMQMPQMKIMMYLMPIMFLGFFNSFAAALSYYYFVATMFTFGQQYIMTRLVDEKEILRKIEEHKKKPVAKKSRFQERLEKMAKQKGYKR